MPYTGNPATNPVDAVRLNVGDISRSTEKLDNTTYLFLLDEQNGNVMRAAARAAEILAATATSSAESKQVGPLRLSFEKSAQRYRDLANQLWRRAGTGGVGGVLPFVGGLSKAEKAANRQDGDRVQPKFRKDMMAYPRGSVGTSDRDHDERLGDY